MELSDNGKVFLSVTAAEILNGVVRQNLPEYPFLFVNIFFNSVIESKYP